MLPRAISVPYSWGRVLRNAAAFLISCRIDPSDPQELSFRRAFSFFILRSRLDTSAFPRLNISHWKMPSPIISIFSTGDYEAHIARGGEILRGGGLVVLPTETRLRGGGPC